MYSKTYRTTVPVLRDEAVDEQQLLWLTAESFSRAAEADALVLSEFTDLGEVLPEDIPPKVEKQMGRPAADYVWRSFEGVGVRGA